MAVATGKYIEQEDHVMDRQVTIARARTTNLIDVGPFNKACVALIAAVDAAGPDPSSEQQETALRPYQAILAWREELQRAVDRTDGAVVVATAKDRWIL